jgi:hypothetical protein
MVQCNSFSDGLSDDGKMDVEEMNGRIGQIERREM